MTSNDSQELLFTVLSVVMALLGWFVADMLYRRKPGMADRLAERVSGLYALLVNKYWIDQIYTGLIVAPDSVFEPLPAVGRGRSGNDQWRRQLGRGQCARSGSAGPAGAVGKYTVLRRLARGGRGRPDLDYLFWLFHAPLEESDHQC